jgi:hypothetical protein
MSFCVTTLCRNTGDQNMNLLYRENLKSYNAELGHKH